MRGLYNGKAPSVTWGSWHLEGIFRNAKIQINFILAKFFSCGSSYLLPAYGVRNLVNLVNSFSVRVQVGSNLENLFKSSGSS